MNSYDVRRPLYSLAPLVHLIRQRNHKQAFSNTQQPIVALTNTFSLNLLPPAVTHVVYISHISILDRLTLAIIALALPPVPRIQAAPPTHAEYILPELHTHRVFHARTTALPIMRDLRKQALESHKTMSRKARSKIASGASSLAGSRAASRNGSRAPSDDGDDGYLSDETAWR